MELKSEFKRAVEKAKRQYMTTRLPKDPETNKPEPLLTFTRRRNLTLKVLDETEEQYHQLYLQLQLRGDARKKQDLAEEACQLLFER